MSEKNKSQPQPQNNIFDVVNFLLKHFDTIKYQVNLVKINQLLYYLQGHHLAQFNYPLFNEPIEAWVFGAVIPHVYFEFFSFVNKPIPNDYRCEGITNNEINPETQEFIKKTLNDYIHLNNRTLSVKIHNEQPFKTAYNPRRQWKNNIITHQSLKDFFTTSPIK